MASVICSTPSRPLSSTTTSILDGPTLGLGLKEIVDELLVVGSAGVDEHQLLLGSRTGTGLVEDEAFLGGLLLLTADGGAYRGGVHEGDDGGGRGVGLAAEQPRLGEHAGQVCREQQARLELLHEGSAYRRLR
jgi:hypothetical protein